MNNRLREIFTILAEEGVTPNAVILGASIGASESMQEIIKGFLGIKYLNVFDVADIFKVTGIEKFNDMVKSDLLRILGGFAMESLDNVSPEDFKVIYRRISEVESEFMSKKAKPLEALYTFYWVNNAISNNTKYNEIYPEATKTKVVIPSDVDLRKLKKLRTLFPEYREFMLNGGGDSEYIDSLIPTVMIHNQSKAIREELSIQKQELSDITGITLSMLNMYENKMKKMSDEIVSKIRAAYVNNLNK